MEPINISKIKDGLFLGDKKTGTNFGVIMQFKISHMVNTSGTQIQYTFESAGIKYLTFNWPEFPSNNVICIKEETAKKLLYFIDDSIKRGTGLLIFSVKGKNRACVAIIIYLMKKYNWSLKKCKEYLSTKKHDVFINKNFTNQLMKFEERLNKKNNNSLINSWFTNDLKDESELLMKNTYLNEVQMTRKKYMVETMVKKYKNDLNNESKQIDGNDKNEIIKEKPHIQWADHINPDNFGKKFLIAKYEANKELFLKKKVKPITIHMEMKPLKSCISKKINTENISNIENNIENNIKDNNKEVLTKNENEENLEKNIINNQIVKDNNIEEDNRKISRKLTYDDQDKFSKEKILDKNKNYNTIDNDKKIVKNLFDDENNKVVKNNLFEIEKNNNLKNINNSDYNNIKYNEDNNKKEVSLLIQDDNNINNNLYKFKTHNININKEYYNNSDDISITNINNFTNDNKYSKFFINSNLNQKKGGISSQKDKKINNTKLQQNKRYYLGLSNSKKSKDNEKDIIIPNISSNKAFKTFNYEYNLNLNNDKISISTLMKNKTKNNDNNYPQVYHSYSSNKRKYSDFIKRNNNHRIINKPKNANIFNKFNSYNFHPSGPVKINNKMSYKLGNNIDRKNDNFLSMDNKMYSNLNEYSSISNNINSNKMNIHRKNRPLSAQKNNYRNKNNINLYFNNSSGFSSNYGMELYGTHHRAPSPMLKKSSTLKNNNFHKNSYQNNNRYRLPSPVNNIGTIKNPY